MTTATRLMTLDEFLAMPETEPASEFICGEVVQKPMLSPNHGIIATEIGTLLRIYMKGAKNGARVITKARHAERPERRAYLPDVSVVLAEHFPANPETRRRGPLELVPDIAIEILSPDDRPSRVGEKMAFYLWNHTPVGWVIDPDERTVDVHRPGLPSTRQRPGDMITAAPVLPNFTLDVGELFAALDD